MMTHLLSRMSRCGIASVTLRQDLRITALAPKAGLAFWRSRAERERRAVAALQRLLAQPQLVPLYGGRTFAEALAFRLRRFFEETGAVALIVVPGRFEVHPRYC